MEPITLLLGLAAIVGTGALTKAGENITDGTGNLAKALWAILRRKAPDSQTVKLLAAGQEIDYQQAVIDLEPIANDVSDPAVVKLLAEVRSLLSSNQELAAKVEVLQTQLSQPKSGDRVTIGKQVNLSQSGTGNTQSNTLNF